MKNSYISTGIPKNGGTTLIEELKIVKGSARKEKHIPDYLSDFARELGRRGGEATKTKHGRKHFEKISKLGVKARKKKKIR